MSTWVLFHIFFPLSLLVFYSSSLWCTYPLYHWGRGPQGWQTFPPSSSFPILCRPRTSFFFFFLFPSSLLLSLSSLSLSVRVSLSLARSLAFSCLPAGTWNTLLGRVAPCTGMVHTREFSHRNRSLGCVGLRSGGICIGCPANMAKKRRIVDKNLKIYTEVTTVTRRSLQMYIYLVKKLAYSMNRCLKHITSAE